MTAQNRFYRPVSERGHAGRYVDIFLCPMLEIYSDMKHSYIVELKYAKYKDSETRVEELRREAIAQADRYADTETVKRGIGAPGCIRLWWCIRYGNAYLRGSRLIGYKSLSFSFHKTWWYGNICLPCKRFRSLLLLFSCVNRFALSFPAIFVK